MPDEKTPAAGSAKAAAAAAEDDEPRYTHEEWLAAYASLERTVRMPVNRGTVAGALHRLERDTGKRAPATLTRDEMVAAIRTFLHSEA